MKNTQQGFTLIELVMVIVILGILAATAIPRFVDLSTEAAQAAVDGVAGSLSSASAINYAARAARNATQTDTTAGCTNAIANSLVDQVTFGAAPANDYSMQGAGVADVTSNGVAGVVDALGDTWTCTVQDNGRGVTATWTLHWAN